MTNSATSKLQTQKKETHSIKISGGVTVIGEGPTMAEAIRDAQGKARHLDRSYQ